MSCIVGLSRSRIHLLAGSSWTSYVQQRNISVSASLMGKRNIRKFFLGNKRGTKLFRRDQAKGKFEDIPIYTEVKDTGFYYDEVFHPVPEMVPEIVVPDLTDCQLKPYVSYRAADIYQSEFTSRDLFEVIYKNKIEDDFKDGKLDENGNPLEPSASEKLTPEEAWTLARKSGSDLFSERIPRQWECLENSLLDGETPRIQISSDDLEHPTERKKRLQAQEQEQPSL